MTHLLISHDNALDRAALSGGSWSLPLANMQGRNLQIPAQSTDATTASTRFVATWSTPEIVRVIALYGISCSRLAEWQVTLAMDEAGTEINRVGVMTDVYPIRADWGSLPFGAVNWIDGRPTETELSRYPRLALLILPVALTIQYAEVVISDPAPLGGVVEIPRGWIGDVWELGVNHNWRPQLGRRPRSVSAETAGGQRSWERRPSPRQAVIEFGWLNETEGRQRAPDLDADVDITGDLLVIPRPDDTQYLARETLYCEQVTLPGATPWAPSLHSRRMQLQEIL